MYDNITINTFFYFIIEKNNIIVTTVVDKSELRKKIIINGLTTISTIYSFKKFLSRNGKIDGTIYELTSCLNMMRHLCNSEGEYGKTISTSPNKNETHIFKMLGNFDNILYGCINSKVLLNKFLNFCSMTEFNAENTFECLYNMCEIPYNNVEDIFDLSYSYKWNTNYLDKDILPNSFIVCVKFNNTGNRSIEYTFGGPGNMVFDREDKIWITNNVVQETTGSSNTVNILNKDGTPCEFSPIIMDYPMGSGYGIATNSSGTIITVGNFGWGGVDPTYPISNFTYNGIKLPDSNYGGILQYVQGIIYDRNDNLWVCSNGNSRISVFFKNNPNNYIYYDIESQLKPFHLKQDHLDNNIVVSCQTNVIKFKLNTDKLEVVFSTFISNYASLLGLDLDSQDNIYVCNSTENMVVKINKNGDVLQNINNNSIITPWGCTINNNKLFTANFGSSSYTNDINKNTDNNGYYSISCSDLIGNEISPDTGYLIQSGGEEVLLSNFKPLLGPVKCYYPLMRQTACHFDKFGYMWVTNNWKPPFLNDVIDNPGGDGLLCFYGLQ
jgi:sugar lactone lactonase YvrE